MFELHTFQNSQLCQYSLVDGELFLIGRGDVCDIQLDDPSVSRVHCRLLPRDGIVRLSDAGSRWGTFINKERLTETSLHVGDEIKIGDSTLILVALSTPDRTTVAPCADKLNQD